MTRGGWFVRFPKHGEVILEGARKRLESMRESTAFVVEVTSQLEVLNGFPLDASPAMLTTLYLATLAKTN